MIADHVMVAAAREASDQLSLLADWLEAGLALGLELPPEISSAISGVATVAPADGTDPRNRSLYIALAWFYLGRLEGVPDAAA